MKNIVSVIVLLLLGSGQWYSCHKYNEKENVKVTAIENEIKESNHKKDSVYKIYKSVNDIYLTG